MKNKNLDKLVKMSANFGGSMRHLRDAAAVGTLVTIGLSSFSTIKNKIQNDLRRKSLLEDLMQNDPIISKEDKDKVLQYYATIFHVAPHLSADKNTVRDLLRNFVTFDKVDLNSIKMLADAEKSMGSVHQGITPADQMKGLTSMLSMKMGD